MLKPGELKTANMNVLNGETQLKMIVNVHFNCYFVCAGSAEQLLPVPHGSRQGL